jgi:23S rRNA (cytosine1962-C5)-methyltransferase
MPLLSLKLKYRIENDAAGSQPAVLFVDKISGLNTHAPDKGKPGLVEILQDQMGRTLYIVSRLDKGTSGALVFAMTPEFAQKLTKKFENHDIKKKYIFLTDKAHKHKEFEHRSLIFKDGNLPSSDPKNSKPNSLTEFKYIKDIGHFHLWEATPKSGKPHQIRLHAQDCGIPVIGDVDHGGRAFYRLCLHAQELEFEIDGKIFKHHSSNPVWTSPLPEDYLKLFECISRRNNLLEVPQDKSECIRWVHQEIEDYRVDQFGEQLWVYWYKNTDPTAEDLKRFEVLSKTLQRPGWIREMINRGAKGENSKIWPISANPAQKRWIAQENGVHYELRSDQGMSPGLFLDQRENRAWVRANSKGKKILNLFCYTGGFTVNAALGGASETCSIDASKNYLEWTQENMIRNGIDTKTGTHQFWEADCIFFLKGCIKKGRKFDLIICDPPSIGRSKEGIFQIHKNLPELLEGCLKCLEPGGQILLSTNYEGWTLEDLQKQTLIYRNIYGIEILPAPPASLDFELPSEEALMKSLIVKRR